MERTVFQRNDADDASVAREASEACAARYDHTLGMNALFALKDILTGEIITPFRTKEVRAEPTYLTVQVGENIHIELWPEHLEFTNHSCNPNCFFNMDSFVIEAIKDIRAGDQLTFFYPSTEWHMQQPFSCSCGAEQCCGTISGADAMAGEKLAAYRLSSFITDKLSRRPQ